MKRHQEKRIGFPGGSVVRSLPANAGNMGLVPGPGRSHMPQSNYAREPQLLGPARATACARQQGKPLQREAHTPQPESSPRAALLARAAGKSPCSNEDSAQQKTNKI